MKSPYTNTTTTYRDFTRSTYSDIVCVVNTSKVITSHDSTSTARKLRASMPYKKSKLLTAYESSDHTSSTSSTSSSRNRVLNQELLQERHVYYEKLYKEKDDVDNRRISSAIIIQALFRGYMARPRALKRRYHPISKKPKLPISKLHDELCSYANALNLKPIPGMNIESYRKTSRRRKRIEHAAAYHICHFFMMISAKRSAIRIANHLRAEKRRMAARIICRFFQYIRFRREVEERAVRNRAACVVVIQKYARRFIMSQRIGHVRHKMFHQRRMNDAAIVIQRSLLRHFKPEASKTSPRTNTLLSRIHDLMTTAMMTANHVISNHIMDDIINMEVNRQYDVYHDMFVDDIISRIIDDTHHHLIEGAVEGVQVARKNDHEKRCGRMADEVMHDVWDDLIDMIDDDIIDDAVMIEYTSMIQAQHHREMMKMKMDDDINMMSNMISDDIMMIISDDIVNDMMMMIADDHASTQHRIIVDHRMNIIADDVMIRCETMIVDDIISSQLIITSSSIHQQHQDISSSIDIMIHDIFEAEILDDVHIIADDMISNQKMIMPKMMIDDESFHDVALSYSNDDVIADDIHHNHTLTSSSSEVKSDDHISSSLDADKHDDKHLIIAEDDNIIRINIIMELYHQGSYLQVFNMLMKDYPDLALHACSSSTMISSSSSSSSSMIPSSSSYEYPAIVRLVVWLLYGNVMIVTGHLHDAKTYYDHCLIILSSTSSSSSLVVSYMMQYLIYDSFGRYHAIMASYDDAISAYNKAQVAIEAIIFTPDIIPSASSSSTTTSSSASSSSSSSYDDMMFLKATVFHHAVQHYHVLLLIASASVAYDRGRYHICQQSLSTINNIITAYQHVDHIIIDPIIISDMMMIEAMIQDVQGEYYQAQATLDAIIIIRSSSLGHHHPYVSKARNYRGEVMMKLGRIDEAGAMIFDAYQHRRKSYLLSSSLNTPDHHHTSLLSYDNISSSIIPSSSSSSITGYRMISSDEYNPDIAESLHSIGIYHLQRGKMIDAYLSFEKAALIREKVFGNHHPLLASSFHMLGSYFLTIGLIKRAEIFYTSAHDIISSYHHTYHPHHIYHHMMMISSASLAEAKGEYRHADMIYDDMMKMMTMMMDEMSIDAHRSVIASSYHIKRANIAAILGRYQEAREMLRGASKVLAEALGENHIEMANGLYVLGKIYYHTGRYQEAKTALDRCLSIHISYHHPHDHDHDRNHDDDHNQQQQHHPYAWHIHHLLCELHRYVGSYQQAAEACDAMLTICVAQYKEHGVYTALSLYSRANIVRDIGLYEEAMDLYGRALTYINEEIHHPDDHDGYRNAYVSMIISDQGECMRLQGRYDEAYSNIKLSIHHLIRQYGPHHFHVAEMKCRLASLYVDTSSSDDVMMMIRDEVYPILSSSVGMHHPLAIYANGIISSSSSSSYDAYHELKHYHHASFPDNHPWLLQLRPRHTDGDSSEISYDDTSSLLSSPRGGNVPVHDDVLSIEPSSSALSSVKHDDIKHDDTKHDDDQHDNIIPSSSSHMLTRDDDDGSITSNSLYHDSRSSSFHHHHPHHRKASYESSVSYDSRSSYGDDHSNIQEDSKIRSHLGSITSSYYESHSQSLSQSHSRSLSEDRDDEDDDDHNDEDDHDHRKHMDKDDDDDSMISIGQVSQYKHAKHQSSHSSLDSDEDNR